MRNCQFSWCIIATSNVFMMSRNKIQMQQLFSFCSKLRTFLVLIFILLLAVLNDKGYGYTFWLLLFGMVSLRYNVQISPEVTYYGEKIGLL